MHHKTIALYQHGAGDLKVSWSDDRGTHEERSFGFDLGGAISFVFGLVAGAHSRGEARPVTVSLRNPFRNRGFQAGFLHGRGDAGPEERGFDYREAHESADLDPRVSSSVDDACWVVQELVAHDEGFLARRQAELLDAWCSEAHHPPTS